MSSLMHVRKTIRMIITLKYVHWTDTAAIDGRKMNRILHFSNRVNDKDKRIISIGLVCDSKVPLSRRQSSVTAHCLAAYNRFIGLRNEIAVRGSNSFVKFNRTITSQVTTFAMD